MLEYLRLCTSAQRYPFAVPDVPIDLNQYLATDDFGYVTHQRRNKDGQRVKSGLSGLELGDPLDEILPGSCIRVLAIDSFPSQSFAGILRELDCISFAFRFSQQTEILDDLAAVKLHTDNRGKGRFRGTVGLKGKIKGPANEDLDLIALDLAGDAAQAANAAEHGRETFSRYAGKIILMDRDIFLVVEAARTIAQRSRPGRGRFPRKRTRMSATARSPTEPGAHDAALAAVPRASVQSLASHVSCVRTASSQFANAVSIPQEVPHRDFRTPEYTGLDMIQSTFWQRCRGIGGLFGHNREETEAGYTTSPELIGSLVKAAANNGALLLDVGPSGGEGEIVPAQLRRLTDIGAWLAVNREALNGCRPWTRSTGRTAGGDQVVFTRKGDTVYVVVLGRPNGDIVIRNVVLGGAATRLGQAKRIGLTTTGGNTLLKAAGDGSYAPVFRIG